MNRKPLSNRAVSLGVALCFVALSIVAPVAATPPTIPAAIAVQGQGPGELTGKYAGSMFWEQVQTGYDIGGEFFETSPTTFTGSLRAFSSANPAIIPIRISSIVGTRTSTGFLSGTAMARTESPLMPPEDNWQITFTGSWDGTTLQFHMAAPSFQGVIPPGTIWAAMDLEINMVVDDCFVRESVGQVRNFDYDGGSTTVTVEVKEDTCEWTATPDPVASWFSVTPSSGTGDGPVTINVQPFTPPDGSPECAGRLGFIRVKSGSDSQLIGIRQGDWSPRCTACPAALANTRLEPDDAGSLYDIRRFRDEVFARTARGREYTRLYYEHSAETVTILESNPWLLMRAARLLDRHAPAIRSVVDDGRTTVTDADLGDLDALLADIAASGSPGLRAAVAGVRRDLRNPEIRAENGLEVRVAGPTEAKHARSDDPLFTAFAGLGSLRTSDILSAAAHARVFTRASRAHAGEVLALLASDPMLALRAPAAFGHVKSALESVVRTGRAEMDASMRDELDAFLGGLERQASRDLSRAIVLVRRDLATPRGLEGLGVRTTTLPAQTPLANAVARPRGDGSTLDFATYFGGSKVDFSNQVVLDSAGNIYVTGSTSATDFPTSNGAQSAYGGGDSDAFVVKLDPTGSTVLFATYLGGSGEDVGAGLAVDAAGAVYVVGTTTSSNFPIAGGAVRRTLGGGRDGFIAKLNASGSTLTLSTYLGGSDEDTATGVAVSGKNVYVTGITTSADFPQVKGLRRSLEGSTDAFVMKLKKGGAKIAYSSFFGGGGLELSSSIAIDAAGNAYIAGVTSSADMPTSNAAQATFGGIFDGFVAKLNAKGSALVYATYLGGNDIDGCTGIAVDAAGNTYLSGVTASTDLPVASAFQPSYGGGVLDAFVAKIRTDGGSLVYSTYLGGSDEDRAFRIAVDSAGRLTVAGLTASSNFPVRVAFQGQLAGGTDAFVATFEAAGSSLVSSTYLGGSGGDSGTAVALGADRSIWVAGETVSTDFPVVEPLQGTNGGTSDLFIVRLKED